MTLPKGIRPLSTNIAHCEVAISKKLNSRKQKCGNQIFKLDEARSAVSKGASPWKGCLFPEIYTAWNTDFQQFFIISHSNVFLNFGLRVCRWDKHLALCLPNCSPAKCFVHADKCCCTVRQPTGWYYFLSLNYFKGQDQCNNNVYIAMQSLLAKPDVKRNNYHHTFKCSAGRCYSLRKYGSRGQSKFRKYNHSCLPILGLWEPTESKAYIAM